MKASNYLMTAGMAAILIFSACKKEETSGTGPGSPSANTICNGNGQNVYYPLKQANSWTYTYKVGSITQPVSPEIIISDTKESGGKQYMMLADASNSMYVNDLYLREDQATHNIYALLSTGEFLEVPASPSANQSWTYGSYTRKVTNISASISTPSCNYSGLLEITEFDGTEIRQKFHYKKGLGLVLRRIPDSTFGDDVFSLSAVSLK